MFLPTLVSLLFFSSATVRASSCIAFDTNWNLLAFGFNGKDWNAGTQDTWSSNITASDRPPFDSANTTCYLSQYTNAIYAINADSKNPSSLYIYDATAFFDYTSSVLFWTMTQTSSVSWCRFHFFLLTYHRRCVVARKSVLPRHGLTQSGQCYGPCVHFLDVPNVPAGSADIFVIHHSYFQPQAQAYPLSNGSAFPATYGQATSFFQADNTVQQEFAFIPTDFSATYIINVETNTTQALAAPTTKDSKATYFAGVTALVQLASDGSIFKA
ncbi:hypothetical protein DFH29DRAFT_167704 [Suillus ampliporus]|nr:hypothetical protein DFH29DRAFT_167704 [Suillus ampliporus]